MSKTQLFDLDGKIAFVSGASRGIGEAIAHLLAQQGAHVIVSSRKLADCEVVAERIRAAGGKAEALACHVGRMEDITAAFDTIRSRHGRLDILINNAADRNQVPLSELTYRNWNQVMAVILGGAFLCSRAAIPHMIAAGGGTIINIGGLTAHTGAHDRAHVITAKAGLVGLTKALAVEFGDKGITVNCVVPGQIGGERSATSGDPAPKPGGEANLVGRMGTFEEVAAMVRTLCLPTGGYITGQTIHVSGGRFMP